MKEILRDSKIRVLVVEDSPSARQLLVYLLNADPHLQVVGVAADGEAAVLEAQRLLPDVITMDIHLPKLDGFEATRKIMETCPTRIVMVTASTVPHEVAATFLALEAGALTVLGKPLGPACPGYQALADELIQTVKLMAEVRVVRRWARSRLAAGAPAAPKREVSAGTDIRLVAIGASTGGPMVLQAILSHLEQKLTAPMLIVQHIAAGFTDGFAEWLGRSSGYEVRVPFHGEQLLPGVAYVAPDGLHMKALASGCVGLVADPPEHGMRPSASYLFRSAATAYGSHAVGVILTGMGRDGAQELKLMQQANAVTIAQDKESSVVYGMPGEAVKLDAATYVLSPIAIAAALIQLVNRRTLDVGVAPAVATLATAATVTLEESGRAPESQGTTERR